MTDTYNLAAFSLDRPVGISELRYRFNPSPKVTFGAAKLIARIAQLLLTLKGSDRTDPNAGCDLLTFIGAFHTSETSYIRNEVNRMLEDIRVQMLHENDPDVIDEARCTNVVCDGIDIIDSTIHINITVITAAKTALKFILPVSINQL